MTQHPNGLVRINREQRLYVLEAGRGYTCLGFDVARRWTLAVAEWTGRPDLAPPARVGTKRAFAAYRRAMAAGHAHNLATGQRCPAHLTPALVGLEGRRVTVQHPDGEREHFTVGKSTGWAPCHLAIASRRSTGGPAVYWPEGARVIAHRAA